MENNLRLLRLRIMLTFTDNLKGSGVQIDRNTTQTKHPKYDIIGDMMKLGETCSRCTASIFLYAVVLRAVCLRATPRGDSNSALIGEEIQVKGRNEEEYPHAKLTRGGEE